MAGPGRVDTSINETAANADPFEFSNKLINFQRNQQALVQGHQAIQENAIKLATRRFGAINGAAAGLLSDPDLGQKDISSKL